MNFQALNERFTNRDSVKFALSYDATAGFLSNFDFNLFNAIVVGNFSLPGVNTEFVAAEMFVDPNAVVDTSRTAGQSGNLTFSSPLFTANAGSQLITDNTLNTDTPGSLTISAQGSLGTVISLVGGTLPVVPSTANVTSAVTLNQTTIRAGNIVIDADADAADLYDDQQADNPGKAGPRVVEGLSQFVGSFSIFAGFAISKGSSSVTIDGGSIQSSDLSVTSDARTDANTRAIALAYGSATLAISNPKATINVQNGAEIDSTGNVSLRSDADASLVSAARVRGRNRAAAISVGMIDLDSKATLSSDSTIRATGTVDILADATKLPSVESTVTGYQGAKGTLSVAYSQSVTDVLAAVNGTVDAGGNLTIDSNLFTANNFIGAYSTTGLGSLAAPFANNVAKTTWRINGPLRWLTKKYAGDVKNDSRNSFGFAGAFAVGYHDSDVESIIGPGASVTSRNGNIDVESTLVEFPKLVSTSYTTNPNPGRVTDRRTVDTRDNSLSLAFSIGTFFHDSKATIANGATVSAAGDLNVSAATDVPWEELWGRGFSRQRGSIISPGDPVTTKLNYNLGVQNGLFTSWAEAFTEAKNVAFGGQVSVLAIDNNAEATIGENARVTVGRDASVISSVENDSLNFVGQFGWFVTGAGALVSEEGGTGIGVANVNVIFNNDSIAEIKSGAVVTSDSLLVMAKSDSTNLSIATQGGKSAGNSINGAASIVSIDDRTLARIDDGATVTTRNGFVEVPRDFETVDTSQSSFFAPFTSFAPKQPLESGSSTLRTNVNTETITLPKAHGLNTGDTVRYLSGGGIPIGGLASNRTYYVTRTNDSAIQLSETRGGTIIDLDLDATTGNAHAFVPGFSTSGISSTDSTLVDMGRKHDLFGNQAVVYYSDPGTSISPLSSGEVYFVQRVDENKLRLSLSEGGTPIVLDASQATADGHVLIPITAETINEVAPTRTLRNITIDNPLESLDSDGNGRITTTDKHVRSITEREYLTDLSLLVVADNNAEAFSGIGGFSWGHSVGVSGSVAVNSINRSTEALIGNQAFDFLSSSSHGPGVGIDSAGDFYLGYNHGFSTGDRVTYAGGGDAVIRGLRDGESYFVTLGTDSNNSGDPQFSIGRSAGEGTATFADTAVGVAVDEIDLGYVHGFQLGDAVVYRSGTSNPIGGLVDGATYFAIPISSTKIALAEWQSDAEAIANLLFDPRDAVQANQIVLAFDHGLSQNEAVRYSAGGGTAIEGLQDGQTYYVHVVNSKTFEFRSTASSNSSITLGSIQDVGSTHTLQRGISHSATAINGAAPTTGSRHTIDLGHFHAYGTGTPLRYDSPGNAIQGLTKDTVYYAIVDGEQTIALATSESEALLGQWQFFEAATAITPNGNNSLIQLATENGYQTGDALVYSRTAFYTGPGSDPTTPISYVDSNGNTGQLIEGATYYAIPVFSTTEQEYDPATDTLSPLNIGVTLALSRADALAGRGLTLQGNPIGFHGFHRKDSRIAIDATAADNSVQFFIPETRIDLSAATATGSDHSIRLALDPIVATQETHGLGRIFTPLSASATVFDPASDISANTITKVAHGLTTGDRLLYDDGATTTVSATAIGGLYSGQIVYAIVTGADSFQLADTPAKATNGEALTLDPTKATGMVHRLRATTLDHTNAIDLGYNHGFKTGDTLVYTNGRGQSIKGLAQGNLYYAIVDPASPTKLQLAVTKAEATAGTVIPLSPYVASGTRHGFGKAIRAIPIADGSTNRLTFGASHPFKDGDQITYDSGGGVSIAPLQSGSSYLSWGRLKTRYSWHRRETEVQSTLIRQSQLGRGIGWQRLPVQGRL
ncbi:MAG: hypothetical protein AAF802_01620 [Planctomycetota bacterium]